jgi:hypothetical protein
MNNRKTKKQLKNRKGVVKNPSSSINVSRNTKNKNLIPGFVKRRSYKPRMKRKVIFSKKRYPEMTLGRLDNRISTVTIGTYIENKKTN